MQSNFPMKTKIENNWTSNKSAVVSINRGIFLKLLLLKMLFVCFPLPIELNRGNSEIESLKAFN